MAKNPNMSKAAPMHPAGIELPYPSGANMHSVKQNEEMGPCDMTLNNGAQPSFPDPPFANGKDVRSYGSSRVSSPIPGIPGGCC